MAFVHSKSSRLLIAGRNYSAEASSAAWSSEDQQADVTTFADTARKTLTGLERGSLQVTYFADGLADGTEWSTRFGEAPVAATLCPEGLTAGNPALFGAVKAPRRSAPTEVSDAVAFQLDLDLDGAVRDSGKVLQDQTGTALTSTTNGASLDDTASSSSGLVAVAHVLTVGTGTVDLKVQDSANDSTWADLVSFTQASAATAEVVTVSGTVERYLRVVATLAGGSPSALFVVAFERL